jgi:hypothetical protein
MPLPNCCLKCEKYKSGRCRKIKNKNFKSFYYPLCFTVEKRPGTVKYHRKQTNKRIRRSDEFKSYAFYRKLYDFWWELY